MKSDRANFSNYRIAAASEPLNPNVHKLMTEMQAQQKTNMDRTQKMPEIQSSDSEKRFQHLEEVSSQI
jgi:hypothetical protein